MPMMIIVVGNDGRGKYFASRSFEGLQLRSSLPGAVFTLKQREGESIREFEERVRQEARARGIKHVEWLD